MSIVNKFLVVYPLLQKMYTFYTPLPSTNYASLMGIPIRAQSDTDSAGVVSRGSLSKNFYMVEWV